MRDIDRKIAGLLAILEGLIETGGSIGLCVHKTPKGLTYAAYRINDETGQVARFETKEREMLMRWVKSGLDKGTLLRLREGEDDEK